MPVNAAITAKMSYLVTLNYPMGHLLGEVMGDAAVELYPNQFGLPPKRSSAIRQHWAAMHGHEKTSGTPPPA